MMSNVLLLLLPTMIMAKVVHIQLRENITQPCPNVKSEIIDRSSLKLKFDMISNEAGSDQVMLTDLNGETRQISFPGCYRVQLSFRMLKPIHNPYVVAFLQLGQNIPCQSTSRSEIGNICSNITETNWCPQSRNAHLRRMLADKKSCQFCHMCDSLKDDSEYSSKAKKYIFNEGSEKCDTEENKQTLHFKMCTPSKDELDEQGEDERDKLQEYWHYLKQGVLTAVVHVMDRSELTKERKKQCQQMCRTYQNKRGVSQTYKNTLLKSIQSLCAPKDEYAACVYHTVKFDVNGDF